MATVIIDYGVGNLGSIRNMLRKVGEEALITSELEAIARADRLVLGGVGAFDAGMANLAARDLVHVLSQRVLERRVPILGICLGMQLFGTGSEEGSRAGLGWVQARSVKFRGTPDGPHRVPHMGWNTCLPRRSSPLLDGLEADSRFYFVHSYHLECAEGADVAAVTRYGYEFPSVIVHGNIAGTQFHPEKSHRFGARLLENFVRMPRC
jgi:imidazole glycerol-phosphate synthase subunit HisH